MSKQILIEDIVSIQSIEEFEESCDFKYDELSDKELFDILVQWHYPGEHSTTRTGANGIDTPFLGYRYEEKYLLSRYEQGLVIGLSYILEDVA